MDDKVDAESTPRDWFAELTARIPSFVGYQGKDQRHTADKTVRDTMVFKLDDLREILSDVIEKANDAETSVVDDISKILRTMNELRDKVEFLGYGDTTFFTDEQLNPDFLSRVYQPVSYTHLRAHETRHDLVCRLLLEKKKYKCGF